VPSGRSRAGRARGRRGNIYRYLRHPCALLTSSIRVDLRNEHDDGAVDDDLSRILEIDGDAPADHGLDLAEAPVRAVRMPDEGTGFEILVLRQSLHIILRRGARPVTAQGEVMPGMAAQGPDDLCALVSARLCHDLVSPLGAIGNGLELLEMSGSGRGAPEIALIADSLENALGKLRFLRIAFGPAESGARQSTEEAAAIAQAAFRGRFSLAWSATRPDIPRLLAKVIHLASLCLERSLPLGAEVAVAAEDGRAVLSVEGRRVAPPAAAWAYLLTGEAPAPARSDSVQFILLRLCLDSCGGRIAAEFGETTARVEVSIPET
jgi:histidine phosphotransferase ChpT